jgi:predicted RNase H-like HicB family nuclease
MNILIRQDGKGFLAEVEGTKNLFTYGKTKKKASEELLHVIDMMLDYHREQIKFEKKIKSRLLKDQSAYAV